MATTQEVKDQVGDDVEAARRALDEERAGEGRTGLISHLEKVIARAEGGGDDDDQQQQQQGDDEGGDDGQTGPPMEEPTPAQVNPTTLGQQAEAGSFRTSMEHAPTGGTEVEGSFDVRPAVTRVGGKLRQVKQIRTS